MTQSNIEQQLLSYKRSLELTPSETVQNAIKEIMQELCNSIGTNLKSFLQDFNEKHHAFCGGQFEFRVTRRSKPDLKIPQRDLLQMKGDQRKFLCKLMHFCKNSYDINKSHHIVTSPCGHILIRFQT